MTDHNEMMEMRAGNNNDEINLLNNEEQEQISGGDTETSCQKGYSSGGLLTGTKCECGYKETIIEAPSVDAVEP